MIKIKALVLLCMALTVAAIYATPALAEYESETSELTGSAEQPEGELGEFVYPGKTEGKVVCSKVAGTWELASKVAPTLKVKGITYTGCTSTLGTLKENATVKCPELTSKVGTGKKGATENEKVKGESSESNQECIIKTEKSGCEIKAPAQVITTNGTTVIHELLWSSIEVGGLKHLLVHLLLHAETVTASASTICQIGGLSAKTTTALLHIIVKYLHLRLV